eukprot:snap_masked-scaffold_63-processed-gene-0.43-mRNA-1 protein AED:1.00 eAED:1.00 QI:0/-1/0/0/-1/1/1/0/4272
MEIETLVARARRVRRPKEQRDVAFGLAELSTKQELHLKLMQKGAIKSLLLLLTKSKDAEAHRMASLALGNICCHKDNKIMFARQGGIKIMVNYLSASENDVHAKGFCAFCLGNVASEAANQQEIAKLGGINVLIELLNLSEEQPGAFGAAALANLAYDKEWRTEIVKNDAIPALVDLACMESQRAQKAALFAMRNISITPEYRVALVNCGIIDPLVLIAKSQNQNLQIEVAAAFCTLSVMPGVKKEITNRGFSTILSQALSNLPALELHSMNTMANLLEDVELREKIVNEFALPVIMNLSGSNNVETRTGASRALANLSSEVTYQSLMVQEGCLQRLVACLEVEKDGRNDCLMYTALALGNFSSTMEYQELIVEYGVVQKFVSLMQNSFVPIEAKRYCSFALCNIFTTPANQHKFIELDGLPCLFSLSNSSDLDSKYFTSCCLVNLAKSLENHENLLEFGIVQPILLLLGTEEVRTRTKAAEVIKLLSQRNNTVAKLLQQGVLKLLIKGLKASELCFLSECLAALHNLLQEREARQEINKGSFLDDLKTMVLSEDEKVCTLSLACLAVAAEEECNQIKLAAKNDAPNIVSLAVLKLRAPNSENQKQSLRLLANLSAFSSNCEEIISLGAHLQIISFTLSNETFCQKSALIALKNFTTHENLHDILCSSGILNNINQVLASKEVEIECQRLALSCVANLSLSAKGKSYLTGKGVPDLLVSLTASKDEDIRQTACFSLGKISEEQAFIDLVTSSGGLQPILYLCRTHNFNIYTELCVCLYQLSLLHQNRYNICNNGGLNVVLYFIRKVVRKKSTGPRGSVSKPVLFAYRCVANLCEDLKNHDFLSRNQVYSLLLQTLSFVSSVELQAECFRAAGNLLFSLANTGSFINKEENILENIVQVLPADVDTKSVYALYAFANASANLEFHHKKSMFKYLSLISDLLIRILKTFATVSRVDDTDLLACQYALLGLANVCSGAINGENVKYIEEMQLVVYYIKFDDRRTRLCALSLALSLLHEIGCHQQFFSQRIFSVVVNEALSVNGTSKLLALNCLKALSSNPIVRVHVGRNGGFDPLLVEISKASFSQGRVKDSTCLTLSFETFYNLTLNEENRVQAIYLGIAPLIDTLLKKVVSYDEPEEDKGILIILFFVFQTLGNICELNDEYLHQKVLNEEIFDSAISLGTRLLELHTKASNVELVPLQVSIFRFIAVLTAREQTAKLLSNVAPFEMLCGLLDKQSNSQILQYGALALGNFLSYGYSQDKVLDRGNIKAVLNFSVAIGKPDVPMNMKKSILYCFSAFSTNENSHSTLFKIGVPSAILKFILLLLSSKNGKVVYEVLSIALFVLRNFVVSEDIAARMVELGIADTLTKVFKLLQTTPESACLFNSFMMLKAFRELACLIRNLSIPKGTKQILCFFEFLNEALYMLTLDDVEIKTQTLAFLANLSEDTNCHDALLGAGLVSRIIAVFQVCQNDVFIERECLRLFANLLSNSKICGTIARQGIIQIIIRMLDAKDKFLVKYAALALFNLSSDPANFSLLLQDSGVKRVLKLLEMNSINSDQAKFSLYCLCNMSSSFQFHNQLFQHNVAAFAFNSLENISTDVELFEQRKAAGVVLCNLLIDQRNHRRLFDEFPHLIPVVLKSIQARGLDSFSLKALVLCIQALSYNRFHHNKLLMGGALIICLKLLMSLDSVTSVDEDHFEVEHKLILTLINLSLSGKLFQEKSTFISSIEQDKLLLYFANFDASFKLFSALVTGNCIHMNSSAEIIKEYEKQFGGTEPEVQRLISLGVANLLSNSKSRRNLLSHPNLVDIICSLARSNNVADKIYALKCLRSLCANVEYKHLLFEKCVHVVLIEEVRVDNAWEAVVEALEGLVYLTFDNMIRKYFVTQNLVRKLHLVRLCQIHSFPVLSRTHGLIANLLQYSGGDYALDIKFLTAAFPVYTHLEVQAKNTRYNVQFMTRTVFFSLLLSRLVAEREEKGSSTLLVEYVHENYFAELVVTETLRNVVSIVEELSIETVLVMERMIECISWPTTSIKKYVALEMEETTELEFDLLCAEKIKETENQLQLTLSNVLPSQLSIQAVLTESLRSIINFTSNSSFNEVCFEERMYLSALSVILYYPNLQILGLALKIIVNVTTGTDLIEKIAMDYDLLVSEKAETITERQCFWSAGPETCTLAIRDYLDGCCFLPILGGNFQFATSRARTEDFNFFYSYSSKENNSNSKLSPMALFKIFEMLLIQLIELSEADYNHLSYKEVCQLAFQVYCNFFTSPLESFIRDTVGSSVLGSFRTFFCLYIEHDDTNCSMIYWLSCVVAKVSVASPLHDVFERSSMLKDLLLVAKSSWKPLTVANILCTLKNLSLTEGVKRKLIDEYQLLLEGLIEHCVAVFSYLEDRNWIKLLLQDELTSVQLVQFNHVVSQVLQNSKEELHGFRLTPAQEQLWKRSQFGFAREFSGFWSQITSGSYGPANFFLNDCSLKTILKRLVVLYSSLDEETTRVSLSVWSNVLAHDDLQHLVFPHLQSDERHKKPTYSREGPDVLRQAVKLLSCRKKSQLIESTRLIEIVLRRKENAALVCRILDFDDLKSPSKLSNVFVRLNIERIFLHLLISEEVSLPTQMKFIVETCHRYMIQMKNDCTQFLETLSSITIKQQKACLCLKESGQKLFTELGLNVLLYAITVLCLVSFQRNGKEHIYFTENLVNQLELTLEATDDNYVKTLLKPLECFSVSKGHSKLISYVKTIAITLFSSLVCRDALRIKLCKSSLLQKIFTCYLCSKLTAMNKQVSHLTFLFSAESANKIRIAKSIFLHTEVKKRYSGSDFILLLALDNSKEVSLYGLRCLANISSDRAVLCNNYLSKENLVTLCNILKGALLELISTGKNTSNRLLDRIENAWIALGNLLSFGEFRQWFLYEVGTRSSWVTTCFSQPYLSLLLDSTADSSEKLWNIFKHSTRVAVNLTTEVNELSFWASNSVLSTISFCVSRFLLKYPRSDRPQPVENSLHLLFKLLTNISFSGNLNVNQQAEHHIINSIKSLAKIGAFFESFEYSTLESLSSFLCNYSSYSSTQANLLNEFPTLISESLNCIETCQLTQPRSGSLLIAKLFQMLANISCSHEYIKLFLPKRHLKIMKDLLAKTDDTQVQRAISLLMYNFSVLKETHVSLLGESASQVRSKSTVHDILELLDVTDPSELNFAAMTLVNFLSNENVVTRLLSAGTMSQILKRYKVSSQAKHILELCLVNLAASDDTKDALLAHGGWRLMTESFKNIESKKQVLTAIFFLMNMSVDANLHKELLSVSNSHFILEDLEKKLRENLKDIVVFEIFGFLISNFACSSQENLLRKLCCVKIIQYPLLNLMSSDPNTILVSLQFLLRIGYFQSIISIGYVENICSLFRKIMQSSFLPNLHYRYVSKHLCQISNVEFCRLTLSNNEAINLLLQNFANIEHIREDSIIQTNICFFLANLSVETKTHFLIDFLSFAKYFKCENIETARQVVRLLNNLLQSIEMQNKVLGNPDLCNIILNMAQSKDNTVMRNTSALLRKLSCFKGSHEFLLQNFILKILNLFTAVEDDVVALQAALVLRDLSSVERNKASLGENIVPMSKLLFALDIDLKITAAQFLCHVSSIAHFTETILNLCPEIPNQIRFLLDIRIREENFLMKEEYQMKKAQNEKLKIFLFHFLSNLSEVVLNHATLLHVGILPMLSSLLLIDSVGLKLNISRFVANLLSNDAITYQVFKKNIFHCFYSLHEEVNSVTQRYAFLGLRFMVTNSETKLSLMTENLTRDMIKLSTRDVLDAKLVACLALNCFSMMKDFYDQMILEDSSGKRIEEFLLCLLKSLEYASKVNQDEMILDCARALANLTRDTRVSAYFLKASFLSIHTCFTALLMSPTSRKEYLDPYFARIFFNFSCDESRIPFLSRDVYIQLLIELVRSLDTNIAKFSLLTLANLAFSSYKARIIDEGYFKAVQYSLRLVDSEIIIASSLGITACCLGTEEYKNQVVELSLTKVLISLLRYSEDEVLTSIALSITGTVLGGKEENKNVVHSDGVAERLLDVLSSSSLSSSLLKTSLFLLGCLAEASTPRQKLFESYIVDLVCNFVGNQDVEVSRVLAYFIALCCESGFLRPYLVSTTDRTKKTVKLLIETMVQLGESEDIETQEYASFGLAHLCSCLKLQSRLIDLGVIKILIRLVLNEKEPKYYASLALLKLANNYENHVAIAENGGIQALLKLTKMRLTDDQLNYKAALTVGHLASSLVESTRGSENVNFNSIRTTKRILKPEQRPRS